MNSSNVIFVTLFFLSPESSRKNEQKIFESHNSVLTLSASSRKIINSYDTDIFSNNHLRSHPPVFEPPSNGPLLILFYSFMKSFDKIFRQLLLFTSYPRFLSFLSSFPPPPAAPCPPPFRATRLLCCRAVHKYLILPINVPTGGFCSHRYENSNFHYCRNIRS